KDGEMQFDNDMYGAGNQIYRDPRGVWRLSNSNLDLGQELQPLFNAVHKHWTETYKPPIEISEEAPQNEGEQKGTEAAQSVVSPKQEEPFEIIKHAFLTWLCIKPQIKVYVKQGKGKKTVTYILPINRKTQENQEAQENQETQENQKTQKIDYSSVPPEHQQKVENYVNTHISEKQLEEYLKKFS
ncbi:MAG: hypothetical protein QW063_02355, partial [Candidatus Nanoarchaeia archaeon]